MLHPSPSPCTKPGPSSLGLALCHHACFKRELLQRMLLSQQACPQASRNLSRFWGQAQKSSRLLDEFSSRKKHLLNRAWGCVHLLTRRRQLTCARPGLPCLGFSLLGLGMHKGNAAKTLCRCCCTRSPPQLWLAATYAEDTTSSTTFSRPSFSSSGCHLS